MIIVLQDEWIAFLVLDLGHDGRVGSAPIELGWQGGEVGLREELGTGQPCVLVGRETRAQVLYFNE